MKIFNLAKQLKDRIKDNFFYTSQYEWRSLPLYAEKFEAKWHKVYQNTWRGKTPGFIRGDAPCAARVSLAELLNFLASLTFGS